MRVEREAVLPVPPEAAWAVLVDWERQAAWMRDADRVTVVSPQREGLGTILEVRTRVLQVPLFTERLEVVGWDPPRELRIAHRSLIHGTGTWSLTPDGSHARFRWTEELALPIPLVGELALLAYRPFMRHLMGGAMRELARLLGPAAT